MERKILVIDDNEAQLELFSVLLKKEYKVLLANNGEDALSIIASEYKNISVILLDLIMPKIDGFEVLKRIKGNQIYRFIPVIVTTVSSDEESQIKAMDLGANAYITKPINSQLLLHNVRNTISLCEAASFVNASYRDQLTGLLNRDSFYGKASKLINSHAPGYYVLSHLNIDHFKVINDQYGSEIGDRIFQYIAKCFLDLGSFTEYIAARMTSDKFAILYPASLRDSEALYELHRKLMKIDFINQTITIRVGRYVVNDLSLPIDSMYDRAILAEQAIQGRYDLFVSEYNESMRDQLIHEQKIVNNMVSALEEGQFKVFLQPQYNHATRALIGAEALVRWFDPVNNSYIPPLDFIHVFERSGFIYELDKYVWEQTCILLRKWIDSKMKVIPISVNISRIDVYHDDFFEVITGLIKKYDISIDILRLEITESAFSEAPLDLIKAVKKLIDYGFTVEIDDFGSGYSSLNTLKDVPAQILKLDMKFFENTHHNTQRGGNIIESVVRMAKWLGMAVIAEGVEEISQADYLKTIGCYYIQGYLYAKPMPISDFEIILTNENLEKKLTRLETVKELNNNTFWDPKSMETLIFNTYVGGACIFEWHKGKTELLRANDRYAQVLGCFTPADGILSVSEIPKYLHGKNRVIHDKMIASAIQSLQEQSSEVELTDPNKPEKIEYIHLTIRIIASTEERYLFYCRADNITAQRKAERHALESAEQLNTIMKNINGGVSAVTIDDKGKVTFLYCNERYYEIFGYTKEQAEKENLDVMSLIIPEDYLESFRTIQQMKLDRLPVIINYRCRTRERKLIYIQLSASLTSMNGHDDVITSVITDITKQKQMEDQFKAIVDNIDGGVTASIIKDGSSDFLIYNDQFCKILGYKSRDEFKKLCGNNKYIGIHPDDLERVKHQFETSDGGKNHFSIEYRIVRKDGSMRFLHNNIRVVYWFGINEPVYLSVANDVTELYEAKQREHNRAMQMQTILNTIDSGVSAVTINKKNKIEYIFTNDMFYQMFGYTKKQFETEIDNVMKLIHPDDLEKTKTFFDKINEEEKKGVYSFRCIKRDGSVMWTECHYMVISLSGVEEKVFFCYNTDITDSKKKDE